MKYLFLAFLFLTLGTSGCSGERALQALNLVVSDQGYRKTSDLRYGTHDRQRMDLYQPEETDQPIDLSTAAPLIVFVHGGAWRTGSKDQYEFVAASLTAEGYTVLIPNYRLYPAVRFPDFVADIASALASYEKFAAIQQPGPTTNATVVLMGHSSGAHQAALLTTDPSYFQQAGVTSDIVGLIGLSGPYDLPIDTEEVAVVFPDIDDEESINPVLQAQRLADRQQPQNPLPPTLLLHGSGDERVTINHTPRFASALRSTGATVTVEILRGGHAGAVVALAGPLEFLNDSLDTVLRYLANLDN